MLLFGPLQGLFAVSCTMNALESQAVSFKVLHDPDCAFLCSVLHSSSMYASRPRGLLNFLRAPSVFPH